MLFDAFFDGAVVIPDGQIGGQDRGLGGGWGGGRCLSRSLARLREVGFDAEAFGQQVVGCFAFGWVGFLGGLFLDMGLNWFGGVRFAEFLLGFGFGHVVICRHVDGLLGVSAKEGVGGHGVFLCGLAWFIWRS